MRNRMLAVAAIIFVSLSSLIVLNARARKAAQEAQAAKPVPTALPSAVRGLTVTQIEWIGEDMVNVHIRNDSGRAVLAFAMAHDEAEEERPTHDTGYMVMTYFGDFEPNPLQPGLEEVVGQSTKKPIRLAAVMYEDGTTEGDRRACENLLQEKKDFEAELTAAVAALRDIKAKAKTRQGLEQALSRFVKDNEPVPQPGGLTSSESGLSITTATISPGTHPFAADMLRMLAKENPPDVAVDEFIRRVEKRLGKAQ